MGCFRSDAKAGGLSRTPYQQGMRNPYATHKPPFCSAFIMLLLNLMQCIEHARYILPCPSGITKTMLKIQPPMHINFHIPLAYLQKLLYFCGVKFGLCGNVFPSDVSGYPCGIILFRQHFTTNKRRLLTLCSDNWKLRNFLKQSGHSNDRCPRSISIFRCMGDDAARVVKM